MAYKNNRIWTPEKVVIHVPETGIQHSRMYLRRSPYADHQPYINAVTPLLPQTPIPGHEDAMSFVNFLGDIAIRTDTQNRIILALIEATTVIKPQTCISALRDGIRMANPENQLKERVIPIVVFDENRAHTIYENSVLTNPNGPKEVYEQARQLGAIALKVTPETIQVRVQETLTAILSGCMPF